MSAPRPAGAGLCQQVFDDFSAVDDLDRAAATYRSILDVDPNHVGSLYALKRIYEKGGKWAELVSELTAEMRALGPNQDFAGSPPSLPRGCRG